MPNKKLLIVSAIYPPVASSGIHRIVRISRYLSEMGVDITVLTLDEKSLPKSFNYDHDILAKIPDSVKVYRIPAIQLLKRMIDLKNHSKPDARIAGNQQLSTQPLQTSKKSLFQKLKDTFTYNLNTPDNYALWIYPAIKAGTRIIREQGIKNVFSSSPPGSSHVVSYSLKKRTGVSWIADFRDPWAQKRWFNPEMTPFKRRKIRRFEQRTIMAADTLIMNTPELLADFKNQYGSIIDKKAVAITNGFDPADFTGLPGTNGRANSEIVICHTGTFYRQRSPMPFLNGLRDAMQSGKLAKRFKVKFIGGVGDFATQVDHFLRDNKLVDTVEMIPPIPHRECLIETMRADVLLIVQPVTPVQIPAKIFEYIATKKPILAVSAEGATANVVLENKLGWWARFDNTTEITAKLIEIDRFFDANAENRWPVDERVLNRFDGKKLVEQLYGYLI